MANVECNSVHSFSSNKHLRQQHLFSLISMLCAPRQSIPASDMCRLIVDSRLSWAVEPIDGRSSWLYLSGAAQARKIADCLVLSAD
jgi:hypothetical protein